jgi:hypothetical protein
MALQRSLRTPSENHNPEAAASKTRGGRIGHPHPVLTPDEVDHYRREGYVPLRRPLLPTAEFEALRAHFEAKLAALPAGERPEGMDVPHFTDPALFRWLLAPPVLDVVEPLLGPDLALFSSHFLCKPAGRGQRVPWHEDSAYWRGQLEPMEVVTVWLAIDPSRRENGCLRVVPRTHVGGFSDYEAVADPAGATFTTEIRDPGRFAARAVAVELEPNEASLHDGRLVHGSEANRSPLRRCGYTMRYVSARTRFDRERFPWHHLYHARGADPGVNRWGDPTRAYPDVVRERGRAFRGH